jgi:hypothetical protein
MGGTHYNKKMGPTNPMAVVHLPEDSILATAGSGADHTLGDLWEPGDGPVSKAFGEWVSARLLPDQVERKDGETRT